MAPGRTLIPSAFTACGRRVPGVRETAGDAQLLLGGDPAELAEAITLLEATPSYRAAFVAAGGRNFERRFRHDAIARRFRAALANGLRSSGDS